jgi:hypothetical protein
LVVGQQAREYALIHRRPLSQGAAECAGPGVGLAQLVGACLALGTARQVSRDLSNLVIEQLPGTELSQQLFGHTFTLHEPHLDR